MIFLISGLILGAGLPAAAEAMDSMLNLEQPEGFIIYEPERITYYDERSNSPVILIDEKDNTHVFWQDTRNDPDPDDGAYLYELFYKKFNKNGKLVVDDTRLTDQTNNTAAIGFYTPGVAPALDSDGNIHIAYIDYTKHKYANNRINSEIYYMKLAGDVDADGASAERSELVLIDEQRVSEGIAHSGIGDLVVDSEDNVHIVWYDHRSASWNWEIYYEKLDKNGNVLVDDMRLTYNLDYATSPKLLLDETGDLHLAFKSYDWDDDMNRIYYMKLDSDGDAIISPKLVTEEGITSPSPYGKGSPSIIFDGAGNINMFWTDERNDDLMEIYMLKLDDDGNALWDEELRLTDNSIDSYMQGLISDINHNIYFGIRQQVEDNHQIFLAVIDQDGDFILEPHQVTATESLSEASTFAFDSHGFLHMAFVDTITGNPEVYLALIKSLTIQFAFVLTGVSGGVLDIDITEDGSTIREIQIQRSKGNPFDETIFVTVTIDLSRGYIVDVSYTPPSGKGGGTGAVPVKLYIVENGELAKQISPAMVNKKKQTATFELDEFLADYF